ncbi:undecaprenyl-diphosphate phosphatase [Mobiluncus curtisii]|uniref:undecaprenyl-diphosphate phosphatase n=1 Tax=Mobiluncus curtisii TaxID=2051 RepID=UPI0014703B3F|nr:undecaprenyl-diphosphate phosphatase [Mobiluncus curtisii]MCV0020529.1 undecaprenyl-diphosphate phosphatase [Mobiluncus curtisii]NMW46727.1 undecaprenyl-diphosphate phosphatase [Mobiluncus curtisii]
MSWWEALILGIVEGITEYLPVSSTGHLTIAEYLMGKQIDDVGMVAFTAVIQIGAIAAAVLYFWSDIWRIIKAWVTGVFHKSARRHPDYRFGWAIIIGSVPIAVVGLLFKDFIETGLRSMWFVAAGLVVWSAVLFAADQYAARRMARKPAHSWQNTNSDNQTTIIQALLIGLMQCVSLIPGVSRSGATISAGLFLGFDRVLATRLSFFLGIPALVAAGTLEGISNFDTIGETVGWAPTLLGLVMSFVIGYVSIAWLLKFVSKHSFNSFIIYRLCIGGLIAVLLIAGVIPAN